MATKTQNQLKRDIKNAYRDGVITADQYVNSLAWISVNVGRRDWHIGADDVLEAIESESESESESSSSSSET
jgi:hypothetical protein